MPNLKRLSGGSLTPELTRIAQALLNLLMEASPRKKWYTGKFLATHLNTIFDKPRMSDIHIRAFVNSLRRQGHPILSSEDGYKYSTDIVEIQNCIEDLQSRENGIREARLGLESAVRSIAMKDQPTLFGENK